MDKHISRSDGVKSNGNNNGQTTQTLLAHWFIYYYTLYSGSVFILVEKRF